MIKNKSETQTGKHEAETRKKRKRGQGEGSIYQRESDGRWTAAVSLGFINGRLKRKSVYGKTRKEVHDKLTNVLNDVRHGLVMLSERQTIKEFLNCWLIDCKKATVHPGTFSSYEQQIRVHIVPKLGHIQLSKLSPQHVQAYMNEGLREGLSARTVNYHRSILRMALDRAQKWNLVSRNVAALVDTLRAQHFELQPINAEQARSFLRAVENDRFEALFVVALSLGLRRGEALGLRWSNIDFDARTLRVTQALQRLNGKLQIYEPKTKASRRVLDLPDSLFLKLKEHRTRQLEEKLKAGSNWQETGLVFVTTVGTPVDPRHVKRRLDSLLKKAKLPHFRVHDLRHYCASLLLAQGVQLKVVSEILGHSKIGITADLYMHVLPSVRKDAIDLMNSILTGTK